MTTNNDRIQPPDKQIKGMRYWFFKYWPGNITVDLLDFSKFPMIHYFEKNIFKFYTVQAIKAWFITKNYDLIISHGAQSAVFYAFFRSLFGKKAPCHIVVDPASFNGGRDNFIELIPVKYSVRSITGIAYHSSIQKEYYLNILKMDSRKIKFIPFGVDIDFFKPPSISTDNSIVSFGHIKRDYRTLIEAWKQVRMKNVKLRLIGIDDIKHFYRGKLPANIEVHGNMNIDTLKQYIARALCVVIPLPVFNYSYGQMSLLQSMSMGKAVIVTRTPSTVDYVADGDNALFVEPCNIEDLAAKILMLHSNPDYGLRLGSNARNTVVGKFSEEIMSHRLYQFTMERAGQLVCLS